MHRRRERPEPQVSIDLTPALDDDQDDTLLTVSTAPGTSRPRRRPPPGPSHPRRQIALAALGGLLVGGATVATVQLVASPDREISGSTTVAELREVEKERLTDLVAADRDAAPFAAHLGEDFLLVDVTGDETPRPQYIDDLTSGQLDFRQFEPTGEILVRLHGRTAVVEHESDVDIAVAGVGVFRHPVRTTVVYERHEDGWSAVDESTTALGDLPRPTQE
jgi:hypothetical protein